MSNVYPLRNNFLSYIFFWNIDILDKKLWPSVVYSISNIFLRFLVLTIEFVKLKFKYYSFSFVIIYFQKILTFISTGLLIDIRNFQIVLVLFM